MPSTDEHLSLMQDIDWFACAIRVIGKGSRSQAMTENWKEALFDK